MSTIIGVIAVILSCVCTFFICVGINKKGTRQYYRDLQAVTLRDLPPNIYFTIMDTDKDGYIIDVMKRLPNNILEPTEDLFRLTGEKNLSNRCAYYVYEAMLNGKIRYLKQANFPTSPAA